MHYIFPMEPLKRIMLLHKESDQPTAAAYALRTWLESRGVASEVVPASADVMELRSCAAASDAVLVLGGDGTVLQAARETKSMGIPIIGFIFGLVGSLLGIYVTAGIVIQVLVFCKVLK